MTNKKYFILARAIGGFCIFVSRSSPICAEALGVPLGLEPEGASGTRGSGQFPQEKLNRGSDIWANAAISSLDMRLLIVKILVMTDRSEEILLAAVKEFIKTGEPVSSAGLYKSYSFGIKPAMIRHELLTLTDEGFLEQSYHSAGRVPSNEGYKFFAEMALQNAPIDPLGTSFERMLEEGSSADMLREFSRQMGLVGVLAGSAFQDIQKHGLEYLFDRLDVDSREDLSAVVRDIEEIEQRLSGARSAFSGNDFLDVFIGRGSPITKSDCLSVMAADYDVGGEKVFFFAIGPKRMDYEKTAKVLKGLKRKSKKKNK